MTFPNYNLDCSEWTTTKHVIATISFTFCFTVTSQINYIFLLHHKLNLLHV